MVRHDHEHSRLACFRALRDGRWLGTVGVADRTRTRVGDVRTALRRLRMEGLVDRDRHGTWRLNSVGLVVGLTEISTADFLDRKRAERKACPRPVSGPLASAAVRTVGPLTTEQLLRAGPDGLKKMFGANMVVTEKPEPGESMTRFLWRMKRERQVKRQIEIALGVPPSLEDDLPGAVTTQEATDGPHAAHRGEDREGLGVDQGPPPDGHDRGPAPVG